MNYHDGTAEYDELLVILATQRAVYGGALAIVTAGQPLSESDYSVFCAVMKREAVPAELQQALLAKAAAGFNVGQIEPNLLFNLEQTVRYLAALALFGLRHCGDRDAGAGVPRAVARMYGLSGEISSKIMNLLAPMAPPLSGGLRERLDEYVNPPKFLNGVVSSVLESLDPGRKPKRIVARISPSRYQHPQDKKTLDALRQAAGFEDLMREFFKHFHEKRARVLNLSNLVRVGPNQFRELYEVYRACVERAGVRPEPEFYLTNGGINGWTSGVERPYITLETGCVSLLSRNELEFIIGHELGHIRCQHVLYQELARWVPRLAQQLPILGGLLSLGIYVALYEWIRTAELTCDRVGLLVCQDLDAAIRVMIKWSGVPPAYYKKLNPQAFLDQNREFENLDSDFLSSIFKMQTGLFMTHPWTVSRAAEIKRWHDKGEYGALMKEAAEPDKSAAPADLLPPLASPGKCPACAAVFPPGDHFCSKCGTPL